MDWSSTRRGQNPPKDTPDFVFEQDVITITGKSISEFPLEPWKKFIDELREILEHTKSLTINFKFSIISSSNSMYLSNVFMELNTRRLTHSIKINWFYHENDEDMQFLGEFYKDMNNKLEFDIIPYTW